MSKQQCLYRIKLYRDRYDGFASDARSKLKKNFDEKINEEIQNLKELHNHTFTEEDLNGIIVSI